MELRCLDESDSPGKLSPLRRKGTLEFHDKLNVSADNFRRVRCKNGSPIKNSKSSECTTEMDYSSYPGSEPNGNLSTRSTDVSLSSSTNQHCARVDTHLKNLNYSELPAFDSVSENNDAVMHVEDVTNNAPEKREKDSFVGSTPRDKVSLNSLPTQQQPNNSCDISVPMSFEIQEEVDFILQNKLNNQSDNFNFHCETKDLRKTSVKTETTNQESERFDSKHHVTRADTPSKTETYLQKEPSSMSSNLSQLAADNVNNSDQIESLSENISSSIPSPENPRSSSESPDDPNWQDSRRTRRNSKRKREAFECCPVCGVTVRVLELQSHYAKEVENLSKICRNSKKQRREETGTNSNFTQVKSNRENRLTAKVARYAAKAKNEVKCPVCSLRLAGTTEDINNHVLNCLSQDEFVVVDGDDDDSEFEEYEIGDQTRIRPISLVPGGYSSFEGQRRQTPNEEDEIDLNVDVDDTLAYGKPQYTELDVIPDTNNDKEEKELLQLRKAVVDSTAQPHVLESRKWSNHGDLKEENAVNNSENQKNVDKEVNSTNLSEEAKSEPSYSMLVVSSLKEKIRDLEEQNKSVKCLICMEPYTKPVVSTTCWHVHCEECWLMTMGVKKLCPQCNTIVFPSDLRRIYL